MKRNKQLYFLYLKSENRKDDSIHTICVKYMLHFKQTYKTFSLTFNLDIKNAGRNLSAFGLNFNIVNCHSLLVGVQGIITTSRDVKIPYNLTNAPTR